MKLYLVLAVSVLLTGCFGTFSRTPVKGDLRLDPTLLSSCARPQPPIDSSERAFLVWAQQSATEADCYRLKRDGLVNALRSTFTINKD